MKIYTKTGDQGTTSLYGGKRVTKQNPRIDAIGSVDELNSYLGVVLSQLDNEKFKHKLLRIQNELFELGADLATPEDVDEHLKKIRINQQQVKELEIQIDYWDNELPKLTNFILPGGTIPAAMIYHARAVCRRAERAVVELSTIEPINQMVLKYLNRLSDWMFMLARVINNQNQFEEIIWKSTE